MDAVARHYFGAGGRKILRGETAIVADGDAAFCQAGAFQVIGGALGTKADVFKREIPGDNRPPAIRAELDGIWLINLLYPLFPFFPLCHFEPFAYPQGKLREAIREPLFFCHSGAGQNPLPLFPPGFQLSLE